MFYKIFFSELFVILLILLNGTKLTNLFVEYLNTLLETAQNGENENFKKRINLYKDEKIKIIRRIFGYFEIAFFCSSALFLITFLDNKIEITKLLLLIISGWMTIKIVGNFKSWQEPIIGRIVYCIFILGTVLNLILGVGTALIINCINHLVF